MTDCPYETGTVSVHRLFMYLSKRTSVESFIPLPTKPVDVYFRPPQEPFSLRATDWHTLEDGSIHLDRMSADFPCEFNVEPIDVECCNHRSLWLIAETLGMTFHELVDAVRDYEAPSTPPMLTPPSMSELYRFLVRNEPAASTVNALEMMYGMMYRGDPVGIVYPQYDKHRVVNALRMSMFCEQPSEYRVESWDDQGVYRFALHEGFTKTYKTNTRGLTRDDKYDIPAFQAAVRAHADAPKEPKTASELQHQRPTLHQFRTWVEDQPSYEKTDETTCTWDPFCSDIMVIDWDSGDSESIQRVNITRRKGLRGFVLFACRATGELSENEVMGLSEILGMKYPTLCLDVAIHAREVDADEDPFQEYMGYQSKLKGLIAEGQGDSKRADEVRDKMDGPWRKLSELDRKLLLWEPPTPTLSGLVSWLKSLPGYKPPQGFFSATVTPPNGAAFAFCEYVKGQYIIITRCPSRQHLSSKVSFRELDDTKGGLKGLADLFCYSLSELYRLIDCHVRGVIYEEKLAATSNPDPSVNVDMSHLAIENGPGKIKAAYHTTPPLESVYPDAEPSEGDVSAAVAQHLAVMRFAGSTERGSFVDAAVDVPEKLRQLKAEIAELKEYIRVHEVKTKLPEQEIPTLETIGRFVANNMMVSAPMVFPVRVPLEGAREVAKVSLEEGRLTVGFKGVRGFLAAYERDHKSQSRLLGDLIETNSWVETAKLIMLEDYAVSAHSFPIPFIKTYPNLEG